MANMIPSVPPTGGAGKDSERLVYEALRGALDDQYFVYYSLNYHHGAAAVDGEIDFLVLHRELGLLVIECKGEGVEQDGQGIWWRQVGNGGPQRLGESPFEQVKRCMWQLREVLQPRFKAAFPNLNGGELPFVFGHAVAFPKRSAEGLKLPLGVERKLIIDAGDLGRMHARILAILQHWQGQRKSPPTPLSEPDFKRFRKDVLHPPFKLAATLGGTMQANAPGLLRLDARQAEVMHGLLGNRRLKVLGGAGTGKTVLALEAARELARRGAQVLFLCYNKSLARVLGQELAGDTGLAGSVRALHFHKLGGLAYEALGRPLEPPPKTDREANRSFWEEEVPLVMAEALEAGKLPRFDAVVVDEAQDFAPYWWDVVEDCLKDRATGSLLVFLDPSQDLYGRPLVLPMLDAQFTLRRNYRNTQEIFELLQRLGAKDLEPHPEGLHGDRPSVHQQEGPAKTLKQVGELLRRLVGTQGVKPEQIAILTPHSLARSTLAGQTELQGIPLAFDPLDRKGAVLHSTIAAFKGLESEVLILLDLDAEDDRCCPNALYVACSRATQSLHIFAKGNWLAGVI